MARLIDADELLKKHTCDVYGAYDDSCMVQAVFVPYIKGAPTIEATPVVHGRWEMISDYYARCPNCRTMFEVRPVPMVFKANNRYCRNCGAKMDGGVSDG